MTVALCTTLKPLADLMKMSLRPLRSMGRAPTAALRAIGRRGEEAARHAGRLGTLFGRSAVALVSGRVSFHDLLDQAFDMGVRTAPLVVLTAILSGIVTAQQGGYQFTGAIPVEYLGSVVTTSIVLELGPVLTAFVLIGRVGARITAEIGTMKVSEQIDALYALGRDPVRVLAAPRIFAGVIATPFLVAIADAVGVLTGMFSARSTLGLGREAFFYGARLFWHDWDLVYSLMKGFTFGLIVPLIAVHMGLATRGGAEGVGRATTSSVVFMILAVLVMDAVFPPLFLT